MEQDAHRAPRSLFSHNRIDHGRLTRPLSDIRELTEPSLFEAPIRLPASRPSQERLPKRAGSVKRNEQQQDATASESASKPAPLLVRKASRPPHSRRSEDNQDHANIYSLPVGNIPPRSSSKGRHAHTSTSHPKRSRSIPRQPAIPLPASRAQFQCIDNTSQAQSPISNAAISRKTSFDPNRNARIPSKTIVKLENPTSEHLLHRPTLQHPRLKVDLLLAAPLFVGGSSVEGVVRIVVDDAEQVRHRKTLTLERVSIDLLGVEEVTQPTSKRNVFLALGNELVDTSHPPPTDMVESEEPLPPFERSWILVPSVSTLPFLLKLPLNVGPPPFHCKFARIRYVLCATLIIKEGGRQLSVRRSQNTALLSVQDPEKALVSLPSPLTASEQVTVSKSRHEDIHLTAGIHRQVWVSGTNLFADVHIVNDSHKTIRKLELRLERIVLCYNHSAAATLETSASGARMFDQKERITIVKTVLKLGCEGWNGVLPWTTVLRTCGLEVPRNHATVTCHSYFEVRYYLYVTIHTAHHKVATVQLPIRIIHMNSLDVPTNSVAQVAAAIEERRGGPTSSRPPGQSSLCKKASALSLQGRAWAAPRMASLDRARVQAQIRDESIKPTSRRHAPPSPRPLTTPPPPPRSTSTPRPGANFSLRNKGSTFSFRTPSSKRKGRVFALEDADEIGERLQHMRKTSFGSSTTDRSVPRGRQPPRNSSALGFYLQDAEAERGRGSMSRTRAPSLRAPSVRAESVRSIARGRPSIDTRGRPSVDTKGRTEEHVPIERREYDRRRRKGKERALDW